MNNEICVPTHNIKNDEEIKNREILMQQSNKSTHHHSLNNGLFLDIQYYMQDTQMDITICRYSAIRGTSIISDNSSYIQMNLRH